MMAIQFLYFDDCPNWRVAHERVTEVLAAHPGPPQVEMVVVTSAEQAEQLRFHGSPSILVAGRDPFATGDEPVGLTCRIYETPNGREGSPTVEQLQAALVRSLRGPYRG
jgi:hypothetical protein